MLDRTKSQTATIDGLNVSYTTRGKGPALLMLARRLRRHHGEADDLGRLERHARPLETLAEDFTSIAFDRRRQLSFRATILRTRPRPRICLRDLLAKAAHWPVMCRPSSRRIVCASGSWNSAAR